MAIIVAVSDADPPLSDEERLATVPEAPVLVQMVETEEILALTNHVRKNVICWKQELISFL